MPAVQRRDEHHVFTANPPSITGYTKGCRCDECRAAWREYGRQYWRRRAAGERPTMPAGPVLEHLSRLYAAGHTAGSIAAVTGVQAKTVRHMLTAGRKRVRSDNGEAILGMALDDSPDCGTHKLPACHVQESLGRLLASGLRHEDVRRAIKVEPSHIAHQEHVAATTARKIRVLCQLRAHAGLLESV